MSTDGRGGPRPGSGRPALQGTNVRRMSFRLGDEDRARLLELGDNYTDGLRNAIHSDLADEVVRLRQWKAEMERELRRLGKEYGQ